jgi:hypothetical protein
MQSPAAIGQNCGGRHEQALGAGVVVVRDGRRGQTDGKVVEVVVPPLAVVVVVVAAGLQLLLTKDQAKPSLLIQEHLPAQGLVWSGLVVVVVVGGDGCSRIACGCQPEGRPTKWLIQVASPS